MGSAPSRDSDYHAEYTLDGQKIFTNSNLRMGNKGSSNEPTQEAKPTAEGFGASLKPKIGAMKKSKCCTTLCCKILYILLAVLTILIAIVEIAVSITTAIASKIYSPDMSGRLVALILLAVTAAIVLSMCIYAVIAVFKNKMKPVHVTKAVLVILAIIQAIITGVSIRVTDDDELTLIESLIDSFKLAREENPRHVKIWAVTQHELTCCGVYSPHDYTSHGISSYLPPDVHISCCPSYDPSRSELVQERARQLCKIQREYYPVGCKSLIVEGFEYTAAMVISVTIVLIAIEILLAIISSCLGRHLKEEADVRSESNRSNHKNDIEDGSSKTKG